MLRLLLFLAASKSPKSTSVQINSSVLLNSFLFSAHLSISSGSTSTLHHLNEDIPLNVDTGRAILSRQAFHYNNHCLLRRHKECQFAKYHSRSYEELYRHFLPLGHFYSALFITINYYCGAALAIILCKTLN